MFFESCSLQRRCGIRCQPVSVCEIQTKLRDVSCRALAPEGTCVHNAHIWGWYPRGWLIQSIIVGCILMKWKRASSCICVLCHEVHPGSIKYRIPERVVECTILRTKNHKVRSEVRSEPAKTGAKKTFFEVKLEVNPQKRGEKTFFLKWSEPEKIGPKKLFLKCGRSETGKNDRQKLFLKWGKTRSESAKKGSKNFFWSETNFTSALPPLLFDCGYYLHQIL